VTRPLIQSETFQRIAVLVGIVIIAAWEVACRAAEVPAILFPKPSDTAEKLLADWPTLLRALAMTLRVTLEAFAAARPSSRPEIGVAATPQGSSRPGAVADSRLWCGVGPHSYP
jgi:hypothetical protein